MDYRQSPRLAILQIIGQLTQTRSLALVVEFGIADRIQATAVTAADLARELDLNPDALYRVLRMLAAQGIFREDDDGRFHATPMSQVLTRDAEDSLASLLRLPWQDLIWTMYLEMPHTLKTGQPAFDRAHGMAFFDYLAAHPEANAQFDAAMALISGPEDACVAEAFDFSRFRRVVDVGGGRGGLLAAILNRHASLEAVLFDQAQVLEAPAYLSDDLRQRVELVPGDFFESVPAGADACLLKRILHDWDDDECVALLTRCREALAPDGRVLIMEGVMKPGNEPDPNKAQDVGMMLLTRGRERTEAEYADLLVRAGLKLTAVHPVDPPSTVSIIDAEIAVKQS